MNTPARWLSLGGRRLAWAVLLSCVLGFAGCAKKGDPAAAVAEFFTRVGAGEVQGAYAATAFGFQAQQSELAFSHNVTELGLNRPGTIATELPEITDNEARVRVEITAADGRKNSFIATLVYETGAWRIHSLKTPRIPGQRPENRFSLVGKGASFTDLQSQPLPSEQEIRELAARTMKDFNAAVNEKSFQRFYNSVSTLWQKQLTVAQLERAFDRFIKTEVRIGGLDEAEMRLDGPPTINPDGVLLVNGHFNTAPYQVYFGMKFVRETPSWKLFGLDVSLQK